jgi:hypothetical protein
MTSVYDRSVYERAAERVGAVVRVRLQDLVGIDKIDLDAFTHELLDAAFAFDDTDKAEGCEAADDAESSSQSSSCSLGSNDSLHSSGEEEEDDDEDDDEDEGEDEGACGERECGGEEHACNSAEAALEPTGPAIVTTLDDGDDEDVEEASRLAKRARR